MADCFFHGQSLPGTCPDCESARRRNLAPEQVQSTIKPLPMETRFEMLGALYLEQLKASAGQPGA
jgi:hypothetical protein